jgi:hypothetical protein
MLTTFTAIAASAAVWPLVARRSCRHRRGVSLLARQARDPVPNLTASVESEIGFF